MITTRRQASGTKKSDDGCPAESEMVDHRERQGGPRCKCQLFVCLGPKRGSRTVKRGSGVRSAPWVGDLERRIFLRRQLQRSPAPIWTPLLIIDSTKPRTIIGGKPIGQSGLAETLHRLTKEAGRSKIVLVRSGKWGSHSGQELRKKRANRGGVCLFGEVQQPANEMP